MQPTRILLSPGPCTPNEAGITLAVIAHFAGKIPLFGVCLGHQAIGQSFGGKVIRAPRLMHGRTCDIEHTGKGIFEGIASPMTATRYHSLIVERASLPACLEITAWADDHTEAPTIMALRHRELDVVGVQFHPESFLTTHGKALLRNWLDGKR
jgi:anthranilate synthase/aminodeoxychorismate synthase-like glutamine amidotransferase